VDLNFSDAAPLMCAGMTTFNALRHSGANPGDTVAIVGLGCLGHLAVQFASKMGFRTVVVAREKDREQLATLAAFPQPRFLLRPWLPILRKECFDVVNPDFDLLRPTECFRATACH
jgi:hypothetical protein